MFRDTITFNTEVWDWLLELFNNIELELVYDLPPVLVLPWNYVKMNCEENTDFYL